MLVGATASVLARGRVIRHPCFLFELPCVVHFCDAYAQLFQAFQKCNVVHDLLVLPQVRMQLSIFAEAALACFRDFILIRAEQL